MQHFLALLLANSNYNKHRKNEDKKMTITSETVLTVLALNEKESPDRRKGSYYNLAIMSEGEVANVSCTKEAYEAVKATWNPLVPLKPYRHTLANSIGKFEFMRISAAMPLEDPAHPAQPTPPDPAQSPQTAISDPAKNGKSSK